MKSFKTIIGVMAICLCLLSFGLVAADADAEGVGFGDKVPTYGGFTDMDDGKLTVYLSNDGATDVVVKVVVKDYDNGDVKGSSTATVAAGAVNQAVSVSFGYGSEGNRFVKVFLYDSADALIASYGPEEITVEHSIWKDWVTYLVVVIIVIVIIILAYFYIRGAPDRAARKAAAIQGGNKAAPAGRTKYDAGSERKSKRQ